MQPKILAHHPLYTVARHCIPHLFTHGKAKADSALTFFAFQDEQDETSGEVLSSLLIACREFGAFEQPTLLVPS